ncbi:MAG TPA: hypothetical protein VFL93_13930 [Longimicrobiaceae bacterium]|nr:hypothetical protein [Longimicrobiaceae bacterium]
MSRNRFVPSLLGPLMLLLLLAAVATPASAQSSDEEAIASYTLTMPKVKAFYAATQALTEVAMKDSKLAEELQASEDASDQQTLAQAAARLEKYPQIKAVLAAQGLTGRDYELVTLTLMQAVLAQGLLGSNPKASLPKGVNPANVQFVRQHQEELKQMNASMQQWQEKMEKENGGGDE